MIELLLGDFLPWIIGGVGAVLGIFVYGRSERRKGRDQERLERRLHDLSSAKATRERLDEIDRDGDTLERLHAAGKLRD